MVSNVVRPQFRQFTSCPKIKQQSLRNVHLAAVVMLDFEANLVRLPFDTGLIRGKSVKVRCAHSEEHPLL